MHSATTRPVAPSPDPASATPPPTTLTEALPHAEFAEHHDLVIEAPPQRVWDALMAARYTDLTVTRPLLAIRAGGRVRRLAAEDSRLLGPNAPTPLLHADEPSYVCGGRLAQPWRASPTLGPAVTTLTELRDSTPPGFLKMGMEFALHPLPRDRTRLSTATLCEPTDDAARRGFTPYWRLIRPFSGLIRMDMLRAVARRARR